MTPVRSGAVRGRRSGTSDPRRGETWTTLSAIPAQQQRWPGTEAELDPRPDDGRHSWVPRRRLTGKRALITGGDSGIGRAVAVIFAREGADVAIGCLPEEQADAAETAGLIADAGRRCVRIPADLRDQAACEQLADAAVRELGGLEILVCNAGFQMAYDGIEAFPAQQLQRTFATNVFSTVVDRCLSRRRAGTHQLTDDR